MNRTSRCKALSLVSISRVVVLLMATSAMTQDVYKLNHFSNNLSDAPDATVRIDNPGLTYGNLCAMIYVFNADQQMLECCGCLETHDGLRTLSVQHDLTSNQLNPQPLPPAGTVVILATLPKLPPDPCEPAGPFTLQANLRAWATHIQNKIGTFYPVTETEFTDSTLGMTELANLQAQCTFIEILGSGHGICTCGTGD